MNKNILVGLILMFLLWIPITSSANEQVIVNPNVEKAFAELQKGKIKEIVIVANPKNPLKTLTLRQVKQIFLGRLRRFPGINTDMNVADREDTSSLHHRFYRTVVRMDPGRLKRYRARYLFSGQGRLPKIVMSEDAMKTFVIKSETAIGYIELAHGDAVPDGLKALYRYKLQGND